MKNPPEKKTSKAALEKLLQHYFGYAAFRPGQIDVINSVLSGNDTLAVMPTGGGKSMCCQIPALIFDGLTVVVSPLIALMQDQVAQLKAAGIPALFLNSTLEWDEYIANMEQIRNGYTRLLYCAPETLITERVKDLLESVHVSCITIDEAHCISEWGHDFRPEYRQLAAVRKMHPNAVCLAMTATATETVRTDIRRTLLLGKAGCGYNEFVSSFNRPNIYLEVCSKSGKARGLVPPVRGYSMSRADELVLDFISRHLDESGIVYCFSRRQVDELFALLTARGFDSVSYHAGLSDIQRAENQTRFVRDEVQLIVATVAFGMGINKPNVRFVIHYDLPKSLEQYYQEIGRAGRDGEAATALLLFSFGDVNKIRFFMQDKSASETAAAEKQLSAMLDFAQTRICRRKKLLAYFGESYDEAAAAESAFPCCDICQNGIEVTESDVTVPVQKLLSAILRTGERFGASYVIDVLFGSRQKRIIDYGHDSLSVFGIGTEYDKQGWFTLVSLLVENGYLKKSADYQVLSLTPLALTALREHTNISLPIVAENRPLQKQFRSETKQKSGKLLASDSKGFAILEDLKILRKKLAAEAEVPPYIIFGDRTMEDIAVKKPTAEIQLTEIYGIGEVKADRYGSMILRIVRHNTA